MSTSEEALNTYLKQLEAIFKEEGVNEISINKPGEVWVEKYGEIRCDKVSEINFNHLRQLGQLIAQNTSQKVSAERPLLSATLPNGYRVQVVLPPACEASSVVMSIRKPSAMQLTLDEYEKRGAFSNTIPENVEDETEAVLNSLLQQKKNKRLFAICSDQ